MSSRNQPCRGRPRFFFMGPLPPRDDGINCASDVAVLVSDPETLPLCFLYALAKMPETLRAMGEHGRRWVVGHLSLDGMVDQYERLLTRVAGE